MNPLNCPLAASDFDSIRCFLMEMPLDELIFITEQIFSQLNSSEKITYDISRYCSEYSDVEGRIHFIKALHDDAVISTIHIPVSYQRDKRLVELVRPHVHDYYIPVARELADTGAALTDDLESTSESITVKNPRWVHADQARKEASPNIAAAGETVDLCVDITGYPDGAPVTFNIFDTGSEPAMRIASVKGTNTNGTATAQWVVDDPDGKGTDLKLEFEGSARSKSSNRVPINLSAMYQVGVTDDEGNPVKNVMMEFNVAGTRTTVQTDENGMAKLPAEDPAAKADIRILWDEKPGETTDE